MFCFKAADRRRETLQPVEKEALAAVWGCERFWLYLCGRPFVLVTDNRAVQLIFANTTNRPPARIERMALRLTQFDYIIQHRPGKDNIADYYSRHPGQASASAFLEEVKSEQYINMIAQAALPSTITLDQIIKTTSQDPEIMSLVTWCTNGTKSELPSKLSGYKAVSHELNVTSNGILLRGQRIIIPELLRSKIVDIAHKGHQGITKTKALIRSKVWFPNMDKMVEEKINNCHICQSIGSKQIYAPMKLSDMPDRAWQQVSGDFFGPMSDGKYWFVNHCDYSRWATVDEINSCSYECVKPVLEKLFTTFGTPEIYKTDNGSPFQSYNFANFADAWGLHHRKITPLWPRANAEVESFMKKLGKVLKIAGISGLDKNHELQTFLRVYRDTPHTTTKISPAMLMLGRSISSGIPQVHDKLQDFNKLAEYHRQARENDKHGKESMRIENDKRLKTRERNISVGSRVLVKWNKTGKAQSVWDPTAYTVTYTNGTLITATRHNHTITRNSSFFKLFHCDDEYDTPRPTHQPSRNASSPATTTSPDSTAQIVSERRAEEHVATSS